MELINIKGIFFKSTHHHNYLCCILDLYVGRIKRRDFNGGIT